MSAGRRRLLLYALGVLIAGGLLFAGFGITVPPDAATRLNGAAILAGMGELDKALALCDTVLEEHPDNVEARVFRATFLGLARRYEEAIAAYDDALAHTEDADKQRDLELDRASVLIEAGRTEEFQRERTRLAAVGDDPRLYILDGLAAAKREDWPAAAKAYRHALELAPEDGPAQARLWNVFVAQGNEALAAGRFDDAQEAFDAACALVPDATHAHLKAAEVRLAREDATGALERLDGLRRSTPGLAPLLARTALALLKAGSADKAAEALQRAMNANAEGIRGLLQTDPAWKPFRDHPAVRPHLDMSQTPQAGLTPGG